jgi:hypothetical protein
MHTEKGELAFFLKEVSSKWAKLRKLEVSIWCGTPTGYASSQGLCVEEVIQSFSVAPEGNCIGNVPIPKPK